MEKQTAELYQTVVSKLQSFSKKWKLMIVLEGFFKWISYISLILVAELILDRVLPLPRFVRMGMVLVWCVLAIWLGYRYLVRAFLKDTSKKKIAAYIENSYPGFENRLQSALQLGKEVDNDIYGYSTAFIAKLIEQAHDIISRVDEELVFYEEHRNLRRAGIAMLTGIILFIGTSILLPDALNNLSHAFVELPKTPKEVVVPKISNVQPGNYTVESGENLSISAQITGKLGAKALLNYRYADGPWDSLEMIPKANQNTQKHFAILENIIHSTEYYISVKEVESTKYKINVEYEPIVSNFQLTLNYPAYTGLSPQTLEPNMGDVTALVGTSVRFNGESNKPLASASIVFSESERVKLEVDKDSSISGRFTVEKSQRYYILLTDKTGKSNSNPIEYKINAIPDEKPFVEILTPGKDVVLDDSMQINLEINSTDDYGVKKIRLVYKVEGREKEHALVIEELKEPQESLLAQYVWDIQPLDLFTEDVVSYHVEVLDADNISGPNVGISKTYTLRYPSVEELYQELEADQQAEKQGMESLLDQQAEAEESVEDLIDKIRKSQELTWREKKEFERILKNQQEIGEKAQELKQQIKETAKDIQKNNLFDQETVQKYQELQELMDRALNEEQKEILKKLNEAMQKQSLTEKEKELMSANFDQKKFKQRLEQMLEFYKKMLVQQKLESAANKAKELASRQEKIVEKNQELMENSKQKDTSQEAQNLSQHEKNVSDDFDKLQSELEKIADELGKDEKYKRITDELSRLTEQSKEQNTSESLKKASQNMKQGNLSKSMQQANQAKSGLDMLSSGLENLMEFMRGQDASEAVSAIRKAIREGLYLSQTHEDVMQDTQDNFIGSNRSQNRRKVEKLHQLASDELSLAEGMNLLASRLWELSKNQAPIDPKIIWTLNSSEDAMKRSARALEDQKPNLALPIQRHALAYVNEAVAKMLEALENMNQQMSMNGMQNMFEQLQQLIQNQGQLNEMTQRLSQQMRKQGRVPGMEEMMKRMAFEQSLIREATERIAEKMEKLSEALGDLHGVAKEMEEVEEKIRKGQIDRELMEKQRRILTRMLESSKSLQKRQLSKKRKGKTAEQIFVDTDTGSEELNPELIKKVKEIQNELRSSSSEDWPEGYRELLKKYYKALSQKTR